LGYIFGDFFAKSAGHPDASAGSEFFSCPSADFITINSILMIIERKVQEAGHYIFLEELLPKKTLNVSLTCMQ
jgi:hypothetical protein